MEKILVSCIHCREIKSVKGIFTHVDRSHLKLTKYSNGNNGSYVILKQRAIQKKFLLNSEYLLNPNKCKACNEILSYNKRKQIFCNRSCSATYTNVRKDYNIVRPGPKKKEISKKYIFVCVNCNLEFETIKKKQQYCTRNCSVAFRSITSRKTRSAFINYRAECSFKFSLKDYPDEFDFFLVEQHGWYKPKNKGNNLYGVSRDHMVSVRWGFDNNIPAKHISHPANCRLVTQSVNSSKNKNNFITYEALLLRIAEWEKKI